MLMRVTCLCFFVQVVVGGGGCGDVAASVRVGGRLDSFFFQKRKMVGANAIIRLIMVTVVFLAGWTDSSLIVVYCCCCYWWWWYCYGVAVFSLFFLGPSGKTRN